jgi:hypothetical protein
MHCVLVSTSSSIAANWNKNACECKVYVTVKHSYHAVSQHLMQELVELQSLDFLGAPTLLRVVLSSQL